MTSQQNGDLLEEVMELAENQHKIIDRQDRLIDMQDKFINELKRHISLLEEEVELLNRVEMQKSCSTCKHAYCRGDREPCMSCDRCNDCANEFTDKWEPMEDKE